MTPSLVGTGLLAPNVVTITGAILLTVVLEVQARVIEGPYLSRVHGDLYADYAAKTGRFYPAIACLHTST